MDETVALIEKYKARLDPDNDFKKIFRALQKLNEIEMTIELLQATGIGKAVNGFRKTKGLAEFAKEIVNKWKRLVNQPPTASHESRSSREGLCSVKTEPVEYDPAQNWEMSKQHSYKPSVKQERVEDDEYDPSQNWQMQNGSDSSSNAQTSNPAKIKREKPSPSKQKKRRKHNDDARASPKIQHQEQEASREAELLATLQRTQEELKRIKKQKKKSEVKVKVEKESPERVFESPTQNGEVEEYDPRSNYEVSNSPSTYDPGSPGSSQSYEPPTQDEEYDPGGGDPSTSYQPSMTFDPGPSRVTEQDTDKDSDGSYEEDEPGVYLLHHRRSSSDYRRRSSENSNDIQNTSFVLSTTLYERNKSVDSEDGTWGSKANGIRGESGSFSPFLEGTFKHSIEPDESSSNNKKSIKDIDCSGLRPNKPSKNDDKRTNFSKNYKLSEKPGKTPKIKKEKDSKSYEKQRTSSESASKKTSQEKRKVNCDTGPEKKKLKSSAVKGEKSEVKDAGFLFQDIPQVSNAKKKKKKTKSSRENVKIPTVPPAKSKPKLNLHLPEIHASYRPLPHSSGRLSEKRKSTDLPMTDNQAAELHSKRQTKKMLVYSGGSGGVLTKMMSLFDQCMLVLMNNIDAIDVFGGIPFEIVQPILKKCSPEQLYRLEDSNPYLLEDTDPLWEQHAIREFRGKEPDEMESWREMFLRLSDEREAKLQSLTQIIQEKEARKKPLEKKVMLAYVGANAKPPRSVRRAQEKYGTAVKPRSSSVPSTSRSGASAVRRDIVDSRMSIPEGSITAASVERENRMRMMKDMKKPRVAPMMAKTLKSIGKLRFRR